MIKDANMEPESYTRQAKNTMYSSLRKNVVQLTGLQKEGHTLCMLELKLMGKSLLHIFVTQNELGLRTFGDTLMGYRHLMKVIYVATKLDLQFWRRYLEQDISLWLNNVRIKKQQLKYCIYLHILEFKNSILEYILWLNPI